MRSSPARFTHIADIPRRKQENRRSSYAASPARRLAAPPAQHLCRPSITRLRGTPRKTPAPFNPPQPGPIPVVANWRRDPGLCRRFVPRRHAQPVLSLPPVHLGAIMTVKHGCLHRLDELTGLCATAECCGCMAWRLKYVGGSCGPANLQKKQRKGEWNRCLLPCLSWAFTCHLTRRSLCNEFPCGMADGPC